MRLGGEPPKRSSNLFDDDFASGFEDSKFEKFKPLFKILAIIVVVIGLGIGGLYYFGDKSNDNLSSYDQTSNSDDAKIIDEALSKKAELSQKFSSCTSKASSNGSNLSTSDPDFSKKLISSYDDWLACYDKYPEMSANASPSRSSLELARQNAIDSSGRYKDTYLSSNSYDYKPRPYAPSSPTSSSNPDRNDSDSSPNSSPTYTTPVSDKKDESWCSSKKAEVDNLYAQYQSAREAVSALDTKIFKVDSDVRQKYGGSGMTESQLQNIIASERSNLQSQRPNLVTQQNTAQSKYNSAQSAYSTSCY